MKIENPEKIRNFVIAGHNGCGKTSLCDLMLFKAGVIGRVGSVDQGTTVSDFTADEQEKHSSIYSAYMNFSWKDSHFFFTDTPGYDEFVGEIISSFRSCGFALIVADGTNGLEVGTARSWKIAKSFNLPKAILVNRLDREMADFFAVVDQLQDAYGKNACVPVTLPVGSKEQLSGVVNVLTTPEDQIPEEIREYAAKCKE